MEASKPQEAPIRFASIFHDPPQRKRDCEENSVPLELFNRKKELLHPKYFCQAILMHHWREEAIHNYLHSIDGSSTSSSAHNIIFRPVREGFVLCRN